MPILMEKNQVLLLKVTSVVEKKKTFQKNGSTHYRHDIYLQDKPGNTSVKEYVTQEETQDKFFPGQWQYVKCLFPNEKGDEIEPWDDQKDAPLKQVREIANSLPKGASEDNAPARPQYRPDGHGEAKNCYSVKLTGESITFAMAWAKDLKVAEIAKRKAGSKVTDEDLADMARWADVINNNICERISF